MTQIPPNKTNIVSILGDIFARRGAESYLGEPVSMAEHMLQGARLAEQDSAPDELVAAALLHDIGHYTGEFGIYSPEDTEDRYHDATGAEMLKSCFPRIITDCVRFHVAAKRYLCATDPGYLDQLSAASIHSLSLQGGPMTAKEVAEFETNPFFGEIIMVRKWDDAGKIAGMKTKTFNDYSGLLQKIVDAHAA